MANNAVESSTHASDTIDEDLRLLADALPQLVWITRADGYHIYFNARWCEFTGLERTDSIGEGWLANALHPADRERTMEIWTHSLRTGEHYDIEYRFRGADGEYRWFLGRALPQRDGTGRIVRWFGTCTDIHAQKMAEESLQKSEAWFRTLVEGSADMFGTLTPDATYQYCSPSVKEQLGWRPEDLVGRSAFDFIHPDDASRIRSELAELPNYPSRRVRTSLKFRSGSGEWREIDVTVRLVEDANGAPLIIANSRDTTETARMRRRIEESERLVALGRVASAMAHEFNNVLMGIQPQADILKRFGDTQARASAERIQHSVSRGKSVTEQVLRFTRAELPRVAPVPVAHVVDASLTEVSLQLPSTIRVQSESEDPGLSMLAEASHIEQTIVNLCLNARDAMPDGGTITVSVRRAPDDLCESAGLSSRGSGYVEIAVIDTGAGVPSELQERVFEPLFSTKSRSGGSGLGLSIARQIALAHDGALTLDSTPDAGATFRLFVPLSAPFVRPESRDEEWRVPQRVLIVEDDDLVADGMVASLQSVGVTTFRVSTGASAPDAVGELNPEVVLLDYSLGDMDGTDVYRAIRSRFPAISVVFVTGHADGDVIQKEIGCATAVICSKPATLEQLLSAIAEAQAQSAT
jgi:PAS domain S-box-containing protein